MINKIDSNNREWYRDSIEKIYEKFGSSSKGLSRFQYQENLNKYGDNKLFSDKKVSYFRIFVKQLKSPLVYILLIASITVFFLGDYVDAGIIFSIVALNSIFGAFQEGKAENTMLALKKIVKGYATVLRDGKEIIVEDIHLVKGDVIILRDSSSIPADVRLIESNNLQINQSTLTGESEIVFKKNTNLSATNLAVADQSNMLFRGTYVVSGLAKAIVVETGENTVIGKISKKLSEIKIEVPLQRNIKNLSNIILAFVFVISSAIFIVSFYQGVSIYEIFLTVVAISVSAIPESLPVVVTLVLSSGVWRMSKRNVLVKKLQAVESLGQANILALDKTGTITKNQMTVEKLYVNSRVIDVDGSGYVPEGVFLEGGKKINLKKDADLDLVGKISVLTSIAEFDTSASDKDWKLVSGDPTEASLIILGHKLGLTKKELIYHYPKIQEIPFDLHTKHHSVIHEIDNKIVLMSAGSPEVILNKCNKVWQNGRSVSLTKQKRLEIENMINQFSSEGYRILAMAVNFNSPESVDGKDLPEMTFVGLHGILDAIRDDVNDSVKKAQDANLKVVMITGDHAKTAEAIASKVGIFKTGDITITGQEINELGVEGLVNKIDKISVFARVSPEHKMLIIEAFKKAKFTIAMTGDGINDALSLTAADLGVSMGKTGTEVAKEASDIVLLDDSFVNIIAAVEEGRNIYWTIRKTITYLLATNLGELLVISIAIFSGMPIPLLAAQILWLNLITDTFLVSALAFDPKESNLLKDKFRKPTKYIIDKMMAFRIVSVASLMTVTTLILFSKFIDPNNMEKAWTISLTTLTVFQWYNIFNVRSYKDTIFSRKQLTNIYLFLGLILTVFLHLIAIYTEFMQNILSTTALSLNEWLLILIVCLPIIVLEEFRKLIFRKNKLRVIK